LRDAEDEIRSRGAHIVAIGTGSVRYASAFVRDENIPYTVLVDDDAAAAQAAQVRSSSFIGMFTPRTWKATRATSKRGFHTHRAGKRVTQLGATFIIDTGGALLYSHIDGDSTDHALVSEVLTALGQARE
jgi:peroxiredoxin